MYRRDQPDQVVQGPTYTTCIQRWQELLSGPQAKFPLEEDIASIEALEQIYQNYWRFAARYIRFEQSLATRESLERVYKMPQISTLCLWHYGHSGLSYAEIADLLDMNTAAVHVCLMRARTRFKKLYQHENMEIEYSRRNYARAFFCTKQQRNETKRD